MSGVPISSLTGGLRHGSRRRQRGPEEVLRQGRGRDAGRAGEALPDRDDVLREQARRTDR